MTQVEELETKLNAANYHNKSLAEALQRARKENVELTAQIGMLNAGREALMKRTADLIDALHARIEAAVNEAQARVIDLSARAGLSEEEKLKILAVFEPFRPERVGESKRVGEAKVQ